MATTPDPTMPKVVILPKDNLETKPYTPKTLDWPKAKTHLETYKKHILDFAGKPDHNPYIWLAQIEFYKLENALAEAKDSEAHAKIMALSLDDTPHVSKLKI